MTLIHLTVEELGDQLDEALERVANGERFLIHLDGLPAAYMLSPTDPLREYLAPAERDIGTA